MCSYSIGADSWPCSSSGFLRPLRIPDIDLWLVIIHQIFETCGSEKFPKIVSIKRRHRFIVLFVYPNSCFDRQFSPHSNVKRSQPQSQYRISLLCGASYWQRVALPYISTKLNRANWDIFHVFKLILCFGVHCITLPEWNISPQPTPNLCNLFFQFCTWMHVSCPSYLTVI